jgi:hypothetical protein
MAQQPTTDPVKPRGISLPDSIWECLKTHAKADMRTTSAYATILIFEAINARRQKLGLPAFDSLDDLQAATMAKLQRRHGSPPTNPIVLPKAVGM